MPLVGFEPMISAGEWPQTYALDCAATGTGSLHIVPRLILNGTISSHPLYAPMVHRQLYPFNNMHSYTKPEVCINQELVYVHVFVWLEGRSLGGGGGGCFFQTGWICLEKFL
jgi:hypothetical protein